jgi:signal transduction histidine kinase
VVILASLREGVRFTLIRETDQVLREDLREIELYLQSMHEPQWTSLQQELNRKALGHEYHGWFVQFYDANGKPTWSSINAPPVPVLSPEHLTSQPVTVESLRIRYSPLPRQFDQAVSAVVGCRVSFIARDMAQIDRLVLLVGCCVLFASPLVGLFLMRRMIQPVVEMTRTTSRIHPGELTERVPLRGTGDELDSLAGTINGLLDRISDYLQQEHDFLANAAHELRTPLAAIRSSVEVSLGGARSEEEYRELLAIVVEQCLTLQMLVNQLLLLAETDADRLRTDFEKVDLTAVVSQAVDMFEGVAEEHGLQLEVGRLDEVTVSGNRHHLRQVLNNLLDNAIKFTSVAVADGDPALLPLEERMKIRVDLARNEEAKTASLIVVDHGIGMETKYLPQIFDRFFRADPARQRELGQTGTGLGLSICKAIAEAHGGQIEADSLPGRGMTMRVTLPML